MKDSKTHFNLQNTSILELLQYQHTFRQSVASGQLTKGNPGP